MIKRRLEVCYTALQAIYYASCAFMCGYGSYILVSIGYDSATVGIILSSACLLSFVVNPFIANLSDRSKKYNIFTIGNIIAWVSFFLCIYASFQSIVSIKTTISFILLRASVSVIEPFINSIPGKLEENGVEIKFGVGRSIGSLSYAIFSTIAGFLTEIYPYQIVYVLNIAAYIIAILTYFFLKRSYNALPEAIEREKEETITYTEFVKRHSIFIALCVALVGIYVGYVMVDNLMILIIDNVNGTESEMGLILGIKALVEIPIIFFYDKLEKRFSNEVLLKVAAFGFAIKSLLMYLAKSTTLMFVAQVFQPFGLALMVPSFVSFINRIMDKKEAVRGQSLFVMAQILSTIIATLCGGKIASAYSVSAMLLFAFTVNIISSIAFCLLLKKCK